MKNKITMMDSEKMYHLIYLEEYMDWSNEFTTIELKKYYYQKSREYFDTISFNFRKRN